MCVIILQANSKQLRSQIQKQIAEMNRKQKAKSMQQSNQHRVYHRVSTFTPDQLAFVNYLRQRGYNDTLRLFEEQINEKSQAIHNRELAEFIDAQKEVSTQVFMTWLQEVKKCFQGSAAMLVKVQFLLLVWMCSFKLVISTINQQRLRTYIQKNGVKLSQFPQILPYFALPYISQPASHPFLCKIYTKQWKQQLKSMIVINCTNRSTKQKHNYNYKLNPNNQQIQWLTIIKDLIHICIQFDSRTLQKNEQHSQMLERVKKYQRVIQENDGSFYNQGESIKPSQLSRLVFKTERDDNPQIKLQQHNKIDKNQHQIDQVSSVHEYKFQPLHFSSLKIYIKKLINAKTRHESNKQICLIYYALHCRLQQTHSLLRKKQQILQYVENDILLLKQNLKSPLLYRQIEYLKLVNSMCVSNICISDISQCSLFVYELISIVVESKKYYTQLQNMSSRKQANLEAMEERLLETFGILQKLSFNKTAYAQLMKTQLPASIISYLANFDMLPTNILTYVLALILNIILRNQGKLLFSTIRISSQVKHLNLNKQSNVSLFELMINLWNYLPSINQINQSGMHQSHSYSSIGQQPQSQIQSLIYSIFYILLSLQKNKKIAKSLNFKNMLNKFVLEHNDEYHQKIANYMIQVLESKQNFEDHSQENEDLKQSQFDQQDLKSIVECKGCYWVDDQLIQTTQQNMFDPETAINKFYESAQRFSTVQQKIQNKQEIAYNSGKPKRTNQNLYANFSTPNFLQQQSTSRKKQLQQNKRNESQINRNISSVYMNDKVEGYDPSKYQAWRKLKTSKN